MSQGKAQLSLIGRVREEPVLRKLPNGTSVTAIVVDVPVSNGDPLYFMVDVYGDDADFVAKEIQMGNFVAVEARAVRRTWKDRTTNEPRSRVAWKAITVAPLTPDADEHAAEAGEAGDDERF